MRHLRCIKKTAEVAEKKECNWPMMSFTQSGSEIRIYRVSSDNKLDGVPAS